MLKKFWAILFSYFCFLLAHYPESWQNQLLHLISVEIILCTPMGRGVHRKYFSPMESNPKRMWGISHLRFYYPWLTSRELWAQIKGFGGGIFISDDFSQFMPWNYFVNGSMVDSLMQKILDEKYAHAYLLMSIELDYSVNKIDIDRVSNEVKYHTYTFVNSKGKKISLTINNFAIRNNSIRDINVIMNIDSSLAIKVWWKDCQDCNVGEWFNSKASVFF